VCLIFAAAGSATALGQAGEVSINSQWFFATDAAHPGKVAHAAVRISLESNFHVQSNKPLDEFLVPTVLTVTPPPGSGGGPPGVTVREIVYPHAVTFTVKGFDEPLSVFEHSFVIGIALDVAADVKPGTYPIKAELQYQACDDKTCLAPTTLELNAELTVVAADVPVSNTSKEVFEDITFSESPAREPTAQPVRPIAPPGAGPTPDCDVVAALSEFTVLGTTGGYLSADEFVKFIDEAEAGTIKRSFFEGMGPLLIVALVILGGLALNLTPCVLPLIPINLAIIGAGAQAGSRSRGFALGGTYGFSMAIVYGVLGLVVTLTSTAFGTINSTIWFNVGIAILFVFLGLAMFDVIAIDFTKYQTNLDATKVAKRGTFALAFAMGCITALLAGACVAPVVIQVIVYAGDQYARGSTWALSLPFFLGLGMALPWPFAGAGLSLLPKPGKWMNWVKKGMGAFILAFAAYYGYLAWEIWDSKHVDRAAVETAVKEQLEGGWTASICNGLAQARAENKPVLIDMWATWCKNCLAMDKTTFQNVQVIERLNDYVKIKFQAEDLRATPAREMLERFEGIGLPTYAILRPVSEADAGNGAPAGR
jgi:thiol:disulfide interchange protein DsbD